MTSIFETVGYFGHRVQFSPFIDNMLFCVASSNTECILSNSASLVKSSNYLLDISGSSSATASSTVAASSDYQVSQASSASSSSSQEHKQQHLHHQTPAFNSHLPYCNHPSSTSPLNIQPNLPSASPLNSPSSSSSTGFLYILDHFIEDIANPLKCFRSFYWPFGGLIDATWLNENYLWSASSDGLIQIWNLSSYLPIEDALSDLEPSPDPVKVLSGHSKVINCIDCNLIPSDSNLIVTASADSSIKLWDAKTASLVKCFNLNASHHTSNVTSSIPQFAPLHIPIVRSSASSLASNINFNAQNHQHHLQNVHPHRFTSGTHSHSHNDQSDQTTHQNNLSSSSNYNNHNHNQEQSSSLLQLLEHSHYFHQMDDSQSQGNLCSSTTSSPSSSLSSPSSSTTDSAIHSPSSVSSSYPNTPPSSTASSDHCDHRSQPGLLQSLLQSSPFLAPHRHPVQCGQVPNSAVNVDIPFVTWSSLISSTFASCSNDGQIRIWSSKASLDHQPNLTFSTELNNLTSCDWNKYNEYLLAVSSTNGAISIWDIRSTNSGPVTVINGHKKSVKQVKFSHHSPYQLASVSCDATTKIWTLEGKDSNHYSNSTDRSMAGSLVSTYRHHSDHVYGFDFNPSIKDRVVDCGQDSLVCLYSISPSLNHLSLHGKAPTAASSSLKLNSTSTTRTAASDVSHSFSLFSTVT